MSELRVTAADGGTYRLYFLKENLEYFRTAEIVSGTSANEMRNKIKGYYKNQFGVDPLVSLECELADLSRTADCSNPNVTQHLYTITVPKSISRPSNINVFAVQNTTAADVEYIYPTQLSNPPLSGAYNIECYDTAGNPYLTDDIPYHSDNGAVYGKLVEACPWLRDSVDVWNNRDYQHNVDGLDFILYFRNVKGPMGQFMIHSSTNNPLVGTGMTIEALTIDTYGPNIYYDVLPFEQLFTFDT